MSSRAPCRINGGGSRSASSALGRDLFRFESRSICSIRSWSFSCGECVDCHVVWPRAPAQQREGEQMRRAQTTEIRLNRECPWKVGSSEEELRMSRSGPAASPFRNNCPGNPLDLQTRPENDRHCFQYTTVQIGKPLSSLMAYTADDDDEDSPGRFLCAFSELFGTRPKAVDVFGTASAR